jgi:hypothetical protein
MKLKKFVYSLHGMFGNSLQLKIINQHLKSLGYEVIPLSYHCNQSFEKVSKELTKEMNKNDNSDASIVAFSFGNIIARSILASSSCPLNVKNTKFIQIAPPNSGSIVARKLGSNSLLRNSLLYSVMKTSDIEKENMVNHLMDNDEIFWKNSDEFKIPKGIDLHIIKGNIPNYINPILYPLENDGTIADKDLEINFDSTLTCVQGQHSMILYKQQTREIIQNILEK